MRWTRALGAVCLLSLVLGIGGPGGRALAEEPGAESGALERGLEALRVRMQAKLKEADLLEKAGRADEALVATREVERIYREGLAELLRLVGTPQAPAAPRPGVARPPVAPAPEPTEEDWADDAPEAPGADGGPFRSRGGRRASGAGSGGRSRFPEEPVRHALRWLAAHQSPDGGWEAQGFERWCDGKPNTLERPDGPGKPVYGVGVTGLALSAYLAAGYTHRGDHEFSKVIRHGLAYLKNVQDPEGCFGPRVTQHYIYNHMIASVAMVEAFGMTQSPIFKASAQQALNFIALCRNPYFGWRYGVKPGDNDTSTTAWATMALRSAQLINASDLAAGRPASFTLDEHAFDGVRAWLDKMTDPEYGRVGYVTRGSGPARPMEMIDKFPADKSESMTAVGVLLRILTGESPTSAPIRRGADLMLRLPPVWNPADGSIDMYYWYYGALATFQVGGPHWHAWEAAVRQQIVPNQRMEGNYCGFKGSWDPIDPWGQEGGRVYSTALMALTCSTALRYERVAAPTAPALGR